MIIYIIKIVEYVKLKINIMLKIIFSDAPYYVRGVSTYQENPYPHPICFYNNATYCTDLKSGSRAKLYLFKGCINANSAAPRLVLGCRAVNL